MNWGSANDLPENQRKIGAGARFPMDRSHQLAGQNIHDPKTQGSRLSPIQIGRQSNSVVGDPHRNAIVVRATQRYQEFAWALIGEGVL
jgi:hypothetical protein